MHQTGSFPPLPPLVSLLCPAPRQGAVREGIWASGPAAAGGPGREGGRRLRAAPRSAPGETDGARRCNGTDKGGRGEMHTRRSPRPGPASSGVAAHASRRVPPLPRQTPTQRRGRSRGGADPAPTPPGAQSGALSPARSSRREDPEKRPPLCLEVRGQRGCLPRRHNKGAGCRRRKNSEEKKINK